MDHCKHGETVRSMGSMTMEAGEMQNNTPTTPPPIEHCLAPFSGPALGRTVWFDFSTVEVQIKKKAHFSRLLDLCQWSLAYSIPG